MILPALAFYVFACVTVASAVLVISSRNPVHSVLFLILAFFNAAGLFVLLGAEFLAMILVVVYVGAVAVLFLFVVMMLDINFTELRAGALQYLPVGALIGIILLAELVLIFAGWVTGPGVATAGVGGALAQPGGVTNTHALGALIYTRYGYAFQASGLILLVAMIGAIVLTLRARVGVRRQNIGVQIDRRRAETLEIVKQPVGAGVDIAGAASTTAVARLTSGRG
ncbi:MAG TPA: NADH-quinone oxidoreductase subunit J [Stellaceae bacterium]|nr:NADH-quinone oxidoreductase subunit J [Stellaceae bacterium]